MIQVQAQARATNSIASQKYTTNMLRTIVRYEHVSVWYGPDDIRTLDPGSSRHLSGADGAWHTARMLAEDAWVHWLER